MAPVAGDRRAMAGDRENTTISRPSPIARYHRVICGYP